MLIEPNDVLYVGSSNLVIHFCQQVTTDPEKQEHYLFEPTELKNDAILIRDKTPYLLRDGRLYPARIFTFAASFDSTVKWSEVHAGAENEVTKYCNYYPFMRLISLGKLVPSRRKLEKIKKAPSKKITYKTLLAMIDKVDVFKSMYAPNEWHKV